VVPTVFVNGHFLVFLDMNNTDLGADLSAILGACAIQAVINIFKNHNGEKYRFLFVVKRSH